MAETSYYWAGTTTGDAGTYSDDVFSDRWREIFMHDRTVMGVIRDIDNELAVAGVTSPISVDTGRALVDGKAYKNDASVSVTIPTPSGGTSRIDRIVLRKDWTAQTVRITRIAGAEAGSPSAPAKTQSDGTTWDIDLATVEINDAGNITVTDLRRFVWSPLSLLLEAIQRDAPTDGDILVADAASDGGAKFVDRERIVTREPFSFLYDIPVETGNDKARVPIPDDLDGYRLSYIVIWAKTGPSGGVKEVQVHNITTAVNMLSTTATIDDGETSSRTAATPPVIDTANDDVSAGDVLRLDYLQANGAVGSQVELGFKPA